MAAKILGVLNVTPDSFSDGGKFAGVAAAVEHGLALAAAGADALDIGGESTRPGADPVAEPVEIARVVPVIAALRERLTIPLAIDTMKPGVAKAAFAAGATIWNDVAALSFAPESLEVAAALGGEVVLMHMQGRPQTMQTSPGYQDVVAEVEAFLLARAAAAQAAGVAKAKIWLDPGIGFGKTAAHNLALLQATRRLSGHGYLLLVGASRKRFILQIDPTALDPLDRLGGAIATHLYAARQGAAWLRVHDVRQMKQALDVQKALEP